MSSDTYLPYSRQEIHEDDIQAVVAALRSPLLTQGPAIPEFERELARVCGAKYAVAVNSGTAALHIACLAAGITASDELITSSITFAASANCGAYCGASISFTDIDARTFNMTAATLSPRLSKKTKVVVPVHMAGQSCDMESVRASIAEAERKYGHKIYVIEDASHALGAFYRGKPVGNCQYSDMTVLSFHPVKNITTGEGGAVVTNDETLYKRLSLFRSHGITKDPSQFQNGSGPWYYEQQVLGFNYRTTDFQCALGSSQLKKLENFVKRRSEVACRYHGLLGNIDGIAIPFVPDNYRSAWHLYVLQIDFEKFGKSRTEVMNLLSERKIGTQVHYIPVYKQPFYRKYSPVNERDYPNAENYYKRCLSIPVFPALQASDQERVKANLLAVLGI